MHRSTRATLAVVTAVALVGGLTLATLPASAADTPDPRIAQAQANVAAYCTTLVDDATTTRQRNTRTDLCTLWTRELADLTAATPTPTPTATVAPTTTSAPTTTPPTPTTTAPPSSAWAGPTNTGVPAGVVLQAYTGPCTITAANSAIIGRLVSCDLAINAPNVVINQSLINGTVTLGPAGTLGMVDSEVNASPGAPRLATGVEDHDYTLTRVEIRGGNRGAYCEQRCTIRDSWVHGQRLAEDWHASAVRMEQDTTLIHNTLVCDAPQGPGEQSCSAGLTGYGDFAPIRDNLIEGNYFPAAPDSAYCAYGGSSKGKPYSDQAANIVFRNNVFEKGPTGHCAWWGAIGDWDGSRPGNVWLNNRYTDGTAVLA